MFFYLLMMLAPVASYITGGPCQAQHDLTPSAAYHGTPQDPGDNPPPFRVRVINNEGQVTSNYLPGETYTVRISGTTFFRGFLLQPRLVESDGDISTVKVGKFLEDESWQRVGIKYQDCDDTDMNAVTHVDNRRKFYLNLRWKPEFPAGDVQLALTIVQNQSYFWADWHPESGLIRLNDAIPALDPDQFVEPPQPAPLSTEPPALQTTTQGVQSTEAPSTRTSTTAPSARVPTQEFTTAATPSTRRPVATRRPTTNQLPSNATLPPAANILAIGVNDLTIEYETGRIPPRVWPPIRTKDVVPAAPFAFIEVLPVYTPEALKEHELIKERIELPDDDVDRCITNPCFNDGVCRNIPGDFECQCPPDFAGEKCESFNYCTSNPCSLNGQCRISPSGYECDCNRGWAGKRCDLVCPDYICENGGTCTVLESTGQYGCNCPSGWSGQKCELDTNDCASNPCLNGGTCRDRFAGFTCECREGWYGKTCDRPCVDIYKSCYNQWNEEDRCELSRGATRFFDVNCAVTCGTCTALDTAELKAPPLPPALEPLKFMIGKWKTTSNEPKHFPFNFNSGWSEEFHLMTTEVPMFGQPSLNYSMSAIDSFNNSVHEMNGFLTMARTRPIRTSLSTVSNNGILQLEEGYLNATTLILDTVFNHTLPQLKRTIFQQDAFLVIKVDVTDAWNQDYSFHNYYTRQF